MRTPLATFVLLWLAALIGFVLMAAFASAHDTFPADIWLAHRLQDIHSTALSQILNWTADFADLPLLLVPLLGAAFLLLFVAGRAQVVLLLLGTGVGRLINIGLKDIIERPRPSTNLVHVHNHDSSFAFPSGHAEGAMLLYGLIFYFAGTYLQAARARLPIQAACVWIVVVTGVQRVYVGAHWPSDILGAYYLGLLVVAAFVALDRLVISSRNQ